MKQFSSFGIASLLASSFLFAASAMANGPAISDVRPATATANVPVTLTATVNSSNAIQTCHLYVDLEDVGEMTVSGNTASRSYTFTSGGSRIAFVYCRDTDGNRGSGANTAIWVEGTIVNQVPMSSQNPPTTPPPTTPAPVVVPAPTLYVATPTSTSIVAARTLVKLACPADAGTDDPCKAVYYAGTDGKRHAFPNSKTYFTWYRDFSGVVDLSPAEMAAISLGKNVTYRPGTRMVKFTTDNRVYAVAANGSLRWVSSEAIAIALFGNDWNTKIDDIADSFYTNYTFGADINAASDYNPTTELSAAPTFD